MSSNLAFSIYYIIGGLSIPKVYTILGFQHITAMYVLVEEALSDIRMNARRVVIHLECDYEEVWITKL